MLLTTIRTNRVTLATRRAAFTLIEVLVVVAILVILAGVAAVATTRYLEDARKAKAQLQAQTISTALQAYMTNAANPTSSPPSDLTELAHAEQGYGTAFLKNGVQDLIDPWGNQFQVKVQTGADGAETYLIYTQAKDGTWISQHGIGEQLSRINQ